MSIGLKGGWTKQIAGGSSTISVSRKGPTFGQIKMDINERLKGFGFAAIVAITRTASAIKKAQPEEMKAVFDRPKPWTLNSVYLKPATKSQPWARVWLKDKDASASSTYDFAASRANRSGGYRVSKRQSIGTPAQKYLLPQIKGGPRPAKGFEVLLRSSGKIGRNEFIVPGNIKLDQYGNISQGTITKVLSDLGSLSDPLSNRPGTSARVAAESRWGGPPTPAKRSKYFVATIKGLKAIWQRVGKREIKPIMLIVGQPMYIQRYSFIRVGQRVFSARWRQELELAVREGYAKPKAKKS
jgi:hypothetical protein